MEQLTSWNIWLSRLVENTENRRKEAYKVMYRARVAELNTSLNWRLRTWEDISTRTHL